MLAEEGGEKKGEEKKKRATQFPQTALKISILTALKISALHFWAAHELRSADKVARIREEQEKLRSAWAEGLGHSGRRH